MLSTWFRYREQFVHWPWFKQEPSHRADIDLPAVEHLHRGAMNLLLAGENAGSAELSVFRYDMLRAIERLAVPTIVATHVGDSLYERMSLIDTSNGRVAVRALERGTSPHDAINLAELHIETASVPQPWPPHVAKTGESSARGYFDFGERQIAFRSAGREGSLLLLLPSMPGGGETVETLLEALAEHSRCIAIDPPGCGDSGPAEDDPVEDYRAAVEAVLQHLGEPPRKFVAMGAGRLVAGPFLGPCIEYREWEDERGALPERIVSDPSIVPDLTPDPHGGHFVRAWHLVRDGRLWRDGEIGRRTAAMGEVLDISEIHNRTVSLLKHSAQFRFLTQAVAAEEARVGATAGPSIGSSKVGDIEALLYWAGESA